MAVASFSYSGVQETWVVPAGVTSVTFDVVGASGGTGATTANVAGKGGRTQGTLTTTPGENLYIVVGGVGAAATSSVGGAGGIYQGAAGATTGARSGGGGGGHSFVKRGGTGDAFRRVAAGGGGGASGNNGGGGISGVNGGVSLDTEATASTIATAAPASTNSGGGGGGWVGGLGAQGNSGSGWGGGGGSNMAHSTQTSGVTSTAGYQTGNGYVTLTYTSAETFQQDATVYPINSITVDTGTGIDVRCLDETEGGATDNTQSILNSTQASNAERRWDPATASDTTVVNAATTNDKKGWAYQLAEMDTQDSRCVARLVAQTVTVNMVGTASGTGTGGVGANDVLTPKASLWKYNTSTDVATLIAGASGTAVTISALVAYSGTAWSASVAITVAAAVDFAANEVLMVVIGGNLACGAGLLSGARTTTWILSVDVSTTNVTHGTRGLRKACSQAIQGTIAPFASIVRSPKKFPTGAITPTATMTRRPTKMPAGALVPAGSVVRTPSVHYAGAIGLAGALLRRPGKVLDGTVTPGPSALTRIPVKRFTGSITPTSIVNFVLSKFFTGTIAPAGQVLKTPAKYMTSTLTPGPHLLVRRPTKLLTSSITPTSTIRNLLTKNFRSDLFLSGAVVRTVTKYYTGTLIPAGTLRKTPIKYLTGLISGEGGAPTVIRRIIRIFED